MSYGDPVFIGVDPGFSAGAICAVDLKYNPLWSCAWESRNFREGVVICSNVAKQAKRKFPHATMIYELPFVQFYVKKVDDAKALREIRERGFYRVPASCGKTPINLGMNIGIFLSEFPSNFLLMTPSEWRNVCGCKVLKGPELKRHDILRALELMPKESSLYTTLNARQSDHLADSYLLGLAGARTHILGGNLVISL